MTGVTLIICTYNGRQKLERTLQHVLQQQASVAWELLVVDNASTDGSGAFCEVYLTTNAGSVPWRVVREERPGLLQARICGLYAAQYEVVLFCDDDNYLEASYLQTGAVLMQQHQQIGALGGCGRPVFEQEPPAWFASCSHSYAVGPQADTDGKLHQVPAEVYGAGTFIRKAPLLRFLEKGFQGFLSGRTGTTLVSGDDVEWCYLLQLAGYEIWYEQRLQFGHLMPANRLQWAYYHTMKTGIAAGAGVLFPYASLIRDPKLSVLAFRFQWAKQVLTVTLRYLKNVVVLSRKTNSDKAMKLALAIQYTRMRSYWSRSFHAVPQFRYLRSFL